MLIKDKKILFIGLAFLLIITSSYLLYQNKQKNQDKILGQVKIQPERDTYSVAISSAPGLGLTPNYTLGRSPETVRFRWQTNYGYFVDWRPPDYKVSILGEDVIHDVTKIYWSYSPDVMEKERPPVKITLSVLEKDSSKILTETYLEMEWEEKGIAKVM